MKRLLWVALTRARLYDAYQLEASAQRPSKRQRLGEGTPPAHAEAGPPPLSAVSATLRYMYNRVINPFVMEDDPKQVPLIPWASTHREAKRRFWEV